MGDDVERSNFDLVGQSDGGIRFKVVPVETKETTIVRPVRQKTPQATVAPAKPTPPKLIEPYKHEVPVKVVPVVVVEPTSTPKAVVAVPTKETQGGHIQGDSLLAPVMVGVAIMALWLGNWIKRGSKKPVKVTPIPQEGHAHDGPQEVVQEEKTPAPEVVSVVPTLGPATSPTIGEDIVVVVKKKDCCDADAPAFGTLVPATKSIRLRSFSDTAESPYRKASRSFPASRPSQGKSGAGRTFATRIPEGRGRITKAISVSNATSSCSRVRPDVDSGHD